MRHAKDKRFVCMKEFVRKVLGVVSAFFLLHGTAFAQTTETTGHPPPLQMIGVVIVALLVLGFLIRVSRAERLHFLSQKARRLLPWVETVIGVAMGLSLVNAALERVLFLSQFPMQDGAFGTVLVWIEIAAGTLLLLGLFSRVATLVIVFLFVVACTRFGLQILPLLPFLGIAFFLALLGRGKLSLGSVFHNIFLSIESEPFTLIAYTALRITVGVSFALFGIQKMLYPETQHFLLVLFSTLHLTFISLVSGVFLLALLETFFGVLLAAHIRVRLASLMLLLPFVVSLFSGNSTTILSLLPVAAVLLVFAVIGTREIV